MFSSFIYTKGAGGILRIVICDDDKTALDTYSGFCRSMCVKHDIDAGIRTYGSGSDLMLDLEEPNFYNNVDLLFLDIFMPGMDGVEAAREARALGYTGVIIFLTASEDNYKDAFDVGAFHYITKGESVIRFEEIFLKAVSQTKTAEQKEITLYGWGEIRKIQVRSIEYFEVINKIITVYYDKAEFEFRGSFQNIEKQLENSGFTRIHRGYLVSLSHIKNISYEEVTMLNGKTLPVGRKYYGALKEAVNKIKL